MGSSCEFAFNTELPSHHSKISSRFPGVLFAYAQ